MRVIRYGEDGGVSPCRTGTGKRPTKELMLMSSSGPSMIAPPNGFGRSRIMTRTPCAPAASRMCETVQVKV